MSSSAQLASYMLHNIFREKNIIIPFVFHGLKVFGNYNLLGRRRRRLRIEARRAASLGWVAKNVKTKKKPLHTFWPAGKHHQTNARLAVQLSLSTQGWKKYPNLKLTTSNLGLFWNAIQLRRRRREFRAWTYFPHQPSQTKSEEWNSPLVGYSLLLLPMTLLLLS